MRSAINAAIINDRKILLVRKKDVWILPGGKPQAGEQELECLCREVREELSGTELENMIYYRSFEGITPHSGERLKAVVYFADIGGKLGEPSQEISQAEFVKNPYIYALSDITRKIIQSLFEEGYI